MKMFLTRLGFHSKAVITGDVTQIDLPNDKRSGMIEALEVVAKVEGIAMVQFDDRDVVRHTLVQRIIRAYEEYQRSDGHGASWPGGSNNHPRAPNRHGSAESRRRDDRQPPTRGPHSHHSTRK